MTTCLFIPRSVLLHLLTKETLPIELFFVHSTNSTVSFLLFFHSSIFLPFPPIYPVQNLSSSLPPPCSSFSISTQSTHLAITEEFGEWVKIENGNEFSRDRV